MELAIALIGALGAAGLGLLGVLVSKIFIRLRHVEDALRAEQDYSQLLWNYCRRLLDLYYRHRKPDAPDPEGLPERTRK